MGGTGGLFPGADHLSRTEGAHRRATPSHRHLAGDDDDHFPAVPALDGEPCPRRNDEAVGPPGCPVPA